VKYSILAVLITASSLSFANESCDINRAKNKQSVHELKQLIEYQQEFNVFKPSLNTVKIFNKLTSSHKEFSWKLYGYNSVNINAHSMQDGGVIISMGLDLANNNIIAAAFAHEISHIILNHPIERACASLNTTPLAYTILVQIMHTQEFEADYEAVIILENNGYSRTALIELLKTFGNKPGTDSHPSAQSRINAILNIGR
jgi:Zn-dependent protease with chaperone function